VIEPGYMSVTLPTQQKQFKLFASQTQKLGSLKALVAEVEKNNISLESISDKSDKTNRNSTHGFQSLKKQRISSTVKRSYGMSDNKQTDLKMPHMQLKFVTVNMLSLRLLTIDLSNNKIVALPNEIVLI
jgi:hypothetical protein